MQTPFGLPEDHVGFAIETVTAVLAPKEPIKPGMLHPSTSAFGIS